ncbi:DUF3667 domain-containing protein [Algibacter sp.]|mgnify:FL=1|jgi:hypothetical protein|nr:DUF3667 domain-containing protein [Algibacter sp.]
MIGELCENCKSQVMQNYCPNCGTPIALKRIDGQYILKEISSVLNFDKGILYTIRELLLRPGKNIQKFILEDRGRLVKPIIFIIITSLIYTLAQQFFHFEDGYVNAGGFEESATTKIFGWIQSNYGYANILMAIFIAGWIKVFFRKYEYNFFEILILLCFVMGIGMLIYTVFGIIESTIKIVILQIGGMIALVYTSWAIGRFFDKNKKANYLKGFLSYLLGMITFFLVAIILGMGIDLIQGI